MNVELLHLPPESLRAQETLRALRAAAVAEGITLAETHAYHGGADWLLIWGPGAPNRFPAMRAQLAAGGHVVACDLAYWQREVKFRVSIDAAHPQQWVFARDWPASRIESDGVSIRDVWQPDGHILVAGLGKKATVQYGAETVERWEAAQIAEARRRRPMTAILYRPKHADQAGETFGCPVSSPVTLIDRALDGAALVITYHSNVAVDAIRLGVPAICADGAAAAVYGGWPMGRATPARISSAVRVRFLRNLAWFQWAPAEARETWRFLRTLLCAS